MKTPDQLAEEAAGNWVYKVYAWRGRSPAFMQTQKNRLTAIIKSAIEEALRFRLGVPSEHNPSRAAPRKASPRGGQDQIAAELFSRFGVNLPPSASKWLDDYIKSAIEEATEWPMRNLESQEKQNEGYRRDNLRLRDELRAAPRKEDAASHASENKLNLECITTRTGERDAYKLRCEELESRAAHASESPLEDFEMKAWAKGYDVGLEAAIAEAKQEWDKGLPIKDSYFDRHYGKSNKPRKPRAIICPTCKQDMNEPPRDTKYGDCPQCGQGLRAAHASEPRKGSPASYAASPRGQKKG